MYHIVYAASKYIQHTLFLVKQDHGKLNLLLALGKTL